jgi:hypothetical protein
MERVSFVVERTGERIPCLLNPETLVVRRTAGVRRAASPSGSYTASTLGDDPLVVSGGGRTELELDLLFDTSVVSPPVPAAGQLPVPGDPAAPPVPTDVRDLTRPLWRLAENPGESGLGDAPLVRFVWGKAWNVLGLIASIAERVEQFGPDGGPRRSWLRLRMVRVSQPPEPVAGPAAHPQAILDAAATSSEAAPAAASTEPAAPAPPADSASTYEVVGSGERLDDIAARVYGGRSWLWRFLAEVNNVADPPWVPAGTMLRIPANPPTGQSGEPPQAST